MGLLQIKFEMSYQNTLIPDNAKLKFQLKGSRVHKFENKKKQKIAQGDCEIYEAQANETPSSLDRNHYFRVQNFIEEIRGSSVFIRINYPQNSAYIFEKENWSICSVSFHKNSEGLDKFEKLLSDTALILDYNSENIDANLSQKIKENCPDNLETKDFTTSAKSIFKKVGKNVGILAGKLNNWVAPTANNAATAVSERASKISRESLSEQTKTKWNTVKEGGEKVNQALTNILLPAVNAYRNLTETIGEAFYHSQNNIVKTVREYSLAFSEAANEGQKSIHQSAPTLNQQQVSNYELK